MAVIWLCPCLFLLKIHRNANFPLWHNIPVFSLCSFLGKEAPWLDKYLLNWINCIVYPCYAIFYFFLELIISKFKNWPVVWVFWGLVANVLFVISLHFILKFCFLCCSFIALYVPSYFLPLSSYYWAHYEYFLSLKAWVAGWHTFFVFFQFSRQRTRLSQADLRLLRNTRRNGKIPLLL